MSTPTPTEAHLDLIESVRYSNDRSATLQIADSEARAVAEVVNALTCTHHNDEQRAACPVCLVTTLTAEVIAAQSERDLAITRVASILWSGAIDKYTCGDIQQWVTDYTAEIARLRAEVERLKTCGITELAAINPSVADYCKHWEARAERAEADAAAYLKRAESFSKLADEAEAELATEREKSERYRLVTLRQDAELAAEREKVTMLLSDAYALTKNWHARADRAEAELAKYLSACPASPTEEERKRCQQWWAISGRSP